MKEKGLMKTSCHSKGVITTEESKTVRHSEVILRSNVEVRPYSESLKKTGLPRSRWLLAMTGFTLAEVLITLSILGVVAAISIPNIIQQYQKRVTVTKLQKVYSELNKAVTNIKLLTGCQTLTCAGLGDIESKEITEDFIKKAGFKNYSSFGGGGYQFCTYGINYSSALSCFNNIYTNKSTGIGYRITNSNASFIRDEPAALIGVYIKIPNKKGRYHLINGKDVFYFMIDNDFNIEPAAICYGGRWCLAFKYKTILNNDNYYCSKEVNSVYSGTGCAARIIQDGWKMNY